MRKKQVAVIDVGSSKITAVIGERGINKTFIIKGNYSYDYDGYDDGAFFDVGKLKRILYQVAESIRSSTNVLDGIYVGVPGEFTKVIVKESQISFDKKKKIQVADIDALFDSAFIMNINQHTLINRSAIVYELDDFRRIAYPEGIQSEILKGKLSFVVCSDYFINVVKNTLIDAGLKNIDCVSSVLAQALYLVEPETRDRVAIILDVGYISTTFSIIQGDGIMYQNSFSFGGGYLTASLVDKFDIDMDVAEKLKRKVNLSSISQASNTDIIEADNGKYYNVEEIKAVLKNTLEVLCEKVNDAFDDCGLIIPEYVPLFITGGGISYLRGAKEYVSNRLGMMVDVIAPKVPMMDKPSESTILSLLDLALDQN